MFLVSTWTFPLEANQINVCNISPFSKTCIPLQENPSPKSENNYRLAVESDERCFLTTALRGNNSSPCGSRRPHLTRPPPADIAVRKGRQQHARQFPEEFSAEKKSLTVSPKTDGRKRYLSHVATLENKFKRFKVITLEEGF